MDLRYAGEKEANRLHGSRPTIAVWDPFIRVFHWLLVAAVTVALLISLFFYAIACALFSGVFIVRYHLELILLVPLLAGFFAWYMKLGLQTNSPVQNPERLYKERGFVIYLAATVLVGALLMVTRVPVLYEVFNVELVKTPPLWTLEGK